MSTDNFVSQVREGDTDLYNLQEERHFGDVSDYWYNCGGFALSTYNWYNCGGFALSAYNWYRPCNTQKGTVHIDTDEEETPEVYLHKCLKDMYNDFKGRLRPISSPTDPITSDEYVIAFHIGYGLDYQGANSGYSFHFRRLVQGIWFEKWGRIPPMYVPNNDVEDWYHTYFQPLLHTVYLAYKYPNKEVYEEDLGIFSDYLPGSEMYEYVQQKAKEGYSLEEARDLYLDEFIRNPQSTQTQPTQVQSF